MTICFGTVGLTSRVLENKESKHENHQFHHKEGLRKGLMNHWFPLRLYRPSFLSVFFVSSRHRPRDGCAKSFWLTGGRMEQVAQQGSDGYHGGPWGDGRGRLAFWQYGRWSLLLKPSLFLWRIRWNNEELRIDSGFAIFRSIWHYIYIYIVILVICIISYYTQRFSRGWYYSRIDPKETWVGLKQPTRKGKKSCPILLVK